MGSVTFIKPTQLEKAYIESRIRSMSNHLEFMLKFLESGKYHHFLAHTDNLSHDLKTMIENLCESSPEAKAAVDAIFNEEKPNEN